MTSNQAEKQPIPDDAQPVLTRADLAEWLATWDHSWECSSHDDAEDRGSRCDCWQAAARQVLALRPSPPGSTGEVAP